MSIIDPRSALAHRPPLTPIEQPVLTPRRPHPKYFSRNGTFSTVKLRPRR